MVLKDGLIRRIVDFLEEIHCIALKKDTKTTLVQLFAYKNTVFTTGLKLESCIAI